MDQGSPDVRVGDRDRKVVDDQLMAAVGDGVLTLMEYEDRSAQLWEARTRGELAVLVADLPTTSVPSRAPVPRPRAAGSPPPRPLRVVAVMSEDRLATPVAEDQEVQGLALMGTVVLDLRRADLPAEVDVRVQALMGEVKVLVPQDATVHLTGLSLMGERKVDGPTGSGARGSVINIDAYAVMGSVSVRRGEVLPATGGAALSTRQQQVSSRRTGRGARLARRLRGSAVGVVLLLGVGGVVASGTDARPVFGSDVVRVQEGQDDVEVSVLFGSVRVVVPDDAVVRTSGVTVFGSSSGGTVLFGSGDGCQEACDGAGSRQIGLRVIGAFGSVDVLTESEAAAEDADRDRD